jgi:hypothetical protein
MRPASSSCNDAAATAESARALHGADLRAHRRHARHARARIVRGEPERGRGHPGCAAHLPHANPSGYCDGVLDDPRARLLRSLAASCAPPRGQTRLPGPTPRFVPGRGAYGVLAAEGPLRYLDETIQVDENGPQDVGHLGELVEPPPKASHGIFNVMSVDDYLERPFLPALGVVEVETGNEEHAGS